MQIYAPVCGADGKTYGNACEATCAGVAIVSKGPCKTPKPDCFCTEVLQKYQSRPVQFKHSKRLVSKSLMTCKQRA